MKSLMLLIIGFVLLVWGAEKFVQNASALARRLGVSPLIVGLTIVAFGTSMPEFAVSVSAALRGSDAIAVGNVLGSNIFNLLVVVGMASLILPVTIHREVLSRDLPWAIGTTVVLIAMIATGWQIARWEGLILLGLFAILLTTQIRAALKEKVAPDIEDVRPFAHVGIGIVLGIAGIILGAQLSVVGATELARLFGWSETLIGLTIVACGTSLPELCTSVVAAKHGESEIAVGNVIGSNLFNVLFILGAAGAIYPLPVQPELLWDAVILLVISVLFVVPALRGKVSRITGAMMVAGYAAYMVFLVLR